MRYRKHIVFFDGNSCLIILQHWNANAVDALIVHLLEYLVKLCFLFFIIKIVTLFEHNARIFVKKLANSIMLQVDDSIGIVIA